MSRGVIPESVIYLQGMTIMSPQMEQAYPKPRLYDMISEHMFKQLEAKISNECFEYTKTLRGEGSFRLGVYLVTPQEMAEIISNARTKGAEEALRYGRPII